MGRSILAVFAGVVVAMITIIFIEFVGHTVYPPPEGIDASDPEGLRALVGSMPLGALAFVLVAWFLGTFDGAMIAALLAPRRPLRHALAIAAVVLVGGVATMLRIPHPLWMWVAAFVLAAIGGYAGGTLGARIAAQRRSSTA